MKQNWKDRFKKEIQELLENKSILINTGLMFLAIIFVGLLYGSAYINDFDTILVDLDDTSMSRMVVNTFSQSTDFDVEIASNQKEVQEALRKSQKSVGIIIPDGFSKNVRLQKSTDIWFGVDANNYIVANSAYSRGAKLINTINNGIALKTLGAKEYSAYQAKELLQIVNIKSKYLNNPSLGYNTYLSYGIVVAAIFSIMISAFANALIWRNSKERLDEITLKAKLMFYSGYTMILGTLLFLAMALVFKLPFAGNIIFLMLELLLFGGIVFSVSLIVASLCKQEYRVVQLCAFMATSMIFLTGFTWPVQCMPFVIKVISAICPLTPMLHAARAIVVNDCNLLIFLKYFVWQGLLLSIYFPLGMYLFKRDGFNKNDLLFLRMITKKS